ncbi:MFS transporter [Labedella populi]|uniref:MFS transporter n=1 Tax=Labedella populi TaxID=2498850 RepID=A0A444QEE4_9MICO|nr:MFS transporter [Labedella populi]RWZ67894.1 MFS transporter [Labedella populi]
MTTTSATRADRMPLTIWLIAGGIFAMVTSEFMAAGLLPAIAPDVGVPIGQAAFLISGFAAGQVVGAWLIGMPLSRFGPRWILAGLMVVFAIAQTIGTLSPWPVMLALRFVSGAAMSAFFATALSVSVRIVADRLQSRATAAIFTGVTVGTTLGLPLATLAGRLLEWRWAFHLDTLLVLIAAVAIVAAMPKLSGVAPLPFRETLRPLRDARLWVLFGTAGLAIGATLAGFGFFSTILEQVTGVDPTIVPWLLALYGLASVVGNTVVGRLTPRGPTLVVAIGLVVLTAGLLAFWLAPTSLAVVLLALVVVGLTGVSLNPAHTARVVERGGSGPAVTSMLPTIVTGGILLGTALGGVAADAFGVLSPLLLGAAMSLLALMTLIPELVLSRRKSGTVTLAETTPACPVA